MILNLHSTIYTNPLILNLHTLYNRLECIEKLHIHRSELADI